MEKQADAQKIMHLDEKVKILWAFNAVAFAIFMWLFTSFVFGYAFPNGFMGLSSSLYFFAFLMLTGVVLLPYLIWVELRYQNYTYWLGTTELIIRKGILRIERIVIPFEKIQNVNISRTIFERLLKIATLKIETAGTNPGEAEGVIPGVADYHKMVDEILGYVEACRLPNSKPQEEAERPKGGQGQDVKELMGAITALREEVERLREEGKSQARKEEKPKAEKRPPEIGEQPLLEFEGESYKKDAVKRIIPQKKGKK